MKTDDRFKFLAEITEEVLKMGLDVVILPPFWYSRCNTDNESSIFWRIDVKWVLKCNIIWL